MDREKSEFRVDVGVDSIKKNRGVGERAEVYIETDRKSGATNITLQALVWRKGKAGAYVANNARAHWREISWA